MKVTAIVGSPRKKHTCHAVDLFLEKLRSLGGVECEIVHLGDYTIKTCTGCMLCLNRGEELCPLKDDRDALIGKLDGSDGVVFATPNYSFQVSGLMKVFLDRLGFVFHRPRFFGKTFTGIVAQGIYGGDRIVKYLDFVGAGLGFTTVRGSCVTTREPITGKTRARNEAMIGRQGRKFHAQLMKQEFPAPSLLGLMIFRMSRSSIRTMLDDTWRDYAWFREKGWFESDYYYPVRLGPVKKMVGKLFDMVAVRTSGKDS